MMKKKGFQQPLLYRKHFLNTRQNGAGITIKARCERNGLLRNQTRGSFLGALPELTV
jgi:hypothetical protein